MSGTRVLFMLHFIDDLWDYWLHLSLGGSICLVTEKDDLRPEDSFNLFNKPE